MPQQQITINGDQVIEGSILYRGDRLVFLQAARGILVVNAMTGGYRYLNTFAKPNTDPPVDGIYPGTGDGYQPIGSFGVSADATIIAHNNRRRDVWVTAPAVHFWRLNTGTLDAIHLGGYELGENETPIDALPPAVYSDSAWFAASNYVPGVGDRRGWRGITLAGVLGGWGDTFVMPPEPAALVDGSRYSVRVTGQQVILTRVAGPVPEPIPPTPTPEPPTPTPPTPTPGDPVAAERERVLRILAPIEDVVALAYEKIRRGDPA